LTSHLSTNLGPGTSSVAKNILRPCTPEAKVMNDEDGNPLFAFQHLDYIPFGFSSELAPYIE